MKKAVALAVAVTLMCLLSGCENPKPVAELTCKDDPTGRSKEEQMAIGDACFRGGSFKKSSGKVW